MAENIVVMTLTLPDGRTAEARINLAPEERVPRITPEEALQQATRMLWLHAHECPPIH